jgi:hypothetical protein
MSENGITHYCLGNGEMKCDGCKQEKNWQTLNQMPDALRKTMQAQAQRIDDILYAVGAPSDQLN